MLLSRERDSPEGRGLLVGALGSGVDVDHEEANHLAWAAAKRIEGQVQVGDRLSSSAGQHPTEWEGLESAAAARRADTHIQLGS